MINNEELIKRLRDGQCADILLNIAADRIDSLNTRLEVLTEFARQVVDQDAELGYIGRYAELRVRIAAMRKALGEEK